MSLILSSEQEHLVKLLYLLFRLETRVRSRLSRNILQREKEDVVLDYESSESSVDSEDAAEDDDDDDEEQDDGDSKEVNDSFDDFVQNAESKNLILLTCFWKTYQPVAQWS
ncbi:hypothetical protein BCR33DRAFT_752420 [Rhizoclosmatium globosum]|uniref:Uncharacterized protein n=1 Tax=Rhizoclosmatium globosum TaxID=329046 RepID=A0A1Y1ZIX4_9FUNG|nr:hypothetical protein BCR33DRAFT_752420 [Rhizoclosmatium globosum]|eukprot:ORY09785.1 hypothetical protein BCR33DRAFT_752420 [Rhizoclosmatium globosum]